MVMPCKAFVRFNLFTCLGARTYHGIVDLEIGGKFLLATVEVAVERALLVMVACQPKVLLILSL